MMKSPSDFLKKADKMVATRGSQYGDFRDNFKNISHGFNQVLNQEVKPSQAALCMAQLKISRLKFDDKNLDSWIDAVAYVAIAAALAQSEEKKYEVMPKL